MSKRGTNQFKDECRKDACFKGIVELSHVNVIFISFQRYSDIRESSLPR